MTCRIRKVTGEGAVYEAYGRDAEDANAQIERCAMMTHGYHPNWQKVTVEHIPESGIRQGRPIYRGGEDNGARMQDFGG